MKETAEESAELMMALKHDPWTPELDAEAEAFPLEADEAMRNVEENVDDCHPDSWVAREASQPKDGPMIEHAEDDVVPAWIKLLSACVQHEAPNFAWHMAERGCAPYSVRDMARRWREEEFVPPGFADEIEAFAVAVERQLAEGADRAFPR